MQRADLATQISPQVNNNLNSYENYSSAISSSVLPGDRNRTIAMLPTKVNIPVGDDGALRQTDLITAMYGDYDDATLSQPNVMVKNMVANSGYVTLEGGKVSFVNQFLASNKLSMNINQLTPPIGTLKSKPRFVGIPSSYDGIKNYLINDDRAQLTGNYLVTQKLIDTSSAVVSGPFLICYIMSELPSGFSVGDYKLRDVMPFVLNIGGASTPAQYGLNKHWYFNFQNPGINNPENRFTIVQQKYGNFACFCVTSFGSLNGNGSTAVSFDGNVRLPTYHDLPNVGDRPIFFSVHSPPLEILQPNVNFNFMVNEFKVLKQRYKDELLSKTTYSHVLCYSTLPADLAKKAAEQGNFSSFELVDNNYYSAALDARFISELTPNERFNFISLFYAIKKGVNIIGKVVKFVDGALTFVEQFLPSATDPAARDNSNEMLFIDLTTPESVYYQITDQGFSRYNDDSVLKAVMPISFGAKDTDDTVDHPPAYRPLN